MIDVWKFDCILRTNSCIWLGMWWYFKTSGIRLWCTSPNAFFKSSNEITKDFCLILAVFITLAIWAVCSNVPDMLGRNPFWIWCSTKPLVCKKAKIESRKHDVKIFRGTLSKGIGLKLDGSEASPFLWTKTVHAFFQSAEISPDCQITLNIAVMYEQRYEQRLKGMIDILSSGHG